MRQVMAHGRIAANIIERELKKFPEYAVSFGRLFQSDAQRSIFRKQAEYQLADLIVANSSFIKETFVIEGINPEKIIVIPTGCPPCAARPANSGRGNQPLIFLFVGTLSLRKGLPYLLEAWRKLCPGQSAQLWLAGLSELSAGVLPGEESNVKYFGVLSRAHLEKVYQQADVLVLPTLLEGFAHVIVEVLASGLPIITTKESGCGNFVQDGRNGLLVESANTESLSNAMAWCLSNRDKLADMGRISQEQAGAWTIADSNLSHVSAIRRFLEKR